MVEYQRFCRAKRRSRFKNAGALSLWTIQQVYDENLIDNGGTLKCVYCSKELTKQEATLEHKIPLSKSGNNEKSNLAIACRHCNCSKGNKTEKEFKKFLYAKTIFSAV